MIEGYANNSLQNTAIIPELCLVLMWASRKSNNGHSFKLFFIFILNRFCIISFIHFFYFEYKVQSPVNLRYIETQKRKQEKIKEKGKFWIMDYLYEMLKTSHMIFNELKNIALLINAVGSTV